MTWAAAVTAIAIAGAVTAIVFGFIWLAKWGSKWSDAANTARAAEIEQERLRKKAEVDRDDATERAVKAEAERDNAKKTVAVLQAALGDQYREKADEVKKEIDNHVDEDLTDLSRRVFGGVLVVPTPDVPEAG